MFDMAEILEEEVVRVKADARMSVLLKTRREIHEEDIYEARSACSLPHSPRTGYLVAFRE
jgi:hypothetical protein